MAQGEALAEAGKHVINTIVDTINLLPNLHNFLGVAGGVPFIPAPTLDRPFEVGTPGVIAGEAAILFMPFDEFGKAGAAIGKSDDLVPLFRAVQPTEAADLAARNGLFRNPAGLEVKYFSESLEGAQSFAEQATRIYGDGPFSFVQTTIPRSAITPNMRSVVDRGVSTVVVPTEQLRLLSPAQSIKPR